DPHRAAGRVAHSAHRLCGDRDAHLRQRPGRRDDERFAHGRFDRRVCGYRGDRDCGLRSGEGNGVAAAPAAGVARRGAAAGDGLISNRRSAMKALKVLLAAAAVLIAASAAAQQPVKIRVGWVVPVSNLASFMYSAKDVLRHQGKSYVADPTRFQGSTPQLTALGTGDLDVALLGFTSFPLAIQNARMEDLRVIVDEIRDGVPGYYSNEFWVRNDGAVRSVADLKGRVLATNAAGTAVDMAMRAMLRKSGLDDKS